MKKWITIAGLTLCLSAHAHEGHDGHVHGEDHDPIVLSIYTDPDGDVFELAVTPEQIAATPEWNGRGDPPLGIAAAVEAATHWLRETFEGFTEFEPENISLSRVYHDAVEHRWTYSLLINAGGKLGGVKVRHQFMVVVLFDRSVVNPKPHQPEMSAPTVENES
ncbi:MAG TPA: hypothetical protein PKE12_02425 [Kiritimatiellia bacterium]|nr:hypothetical protein [Kiritimatiellia bacterium]